MKLLMRIISHDQTHLSSPQTWFCLHLLELLHSLERKLEAFWQCYNDTTHSCLAACCYVPAHSLSYCRHVLQVVLQHHLK